MKFSPLRIGLACAGLLAGTLRAAPDDAVVVIANGSVPIASISAEVLKDIFTGKTTYWQNGQSVVIAVSADTDDASLKKVSGMDTSNFKTFWQRMVFSGRGHLPRKAADTASLVDLVAATSGAIALVPASVDLKGVKVLEMK
jgi:ABC-type phosphate transport system substrate-binding protein